MLMLACAAEADGNVVLVRQSWIKGLKKVKISGSISMKAVKTRSFLQPLYDNLKLKLKPSQSSNCFHRLGRG